MDDNQQKLALFSNNVRQLILRFKDLKKENDSLYAMVDERDAKIEQLETELAQARRDYQCLKMAKMIDITDGEIKESKKKIQQIIKTIDKCITLLSEKQ